MVWWESYPPSDPRLDAYARMFIFASKLKSHSPSKRKTLREKENMWLSARQERRILRCWPTLNENVKWTQHYNYYGPNSCSTLQTKGINWLHRDDQETVKRNRDQEMLPFKIPCTSQSFMARQWIELVFSFGYEEQLHHLQGVQAGARPWTGSRYKAGGETRFLLPGTTRMISRNWHIMNIWEDIARFVDAAITTGFDGAIPRCILKYLHEVGHVCSFKKLDYFSTECITVLTRKRLRQIHKGRRENSPFCNHRYYSSWEQLNVKEQVKSRMPKMQDCARSVVYSSQDVCKACQRS